MTKKESLDTGAMHFTQDEKKFLLNLARNAIKANLENKKLELNNLPKKFKSKTACFVTLHKYKKLQGCIGSLTAHEPLYKNIVSNAVNAAFFDPRFSPLTKEDLGVIEIEISILSEPKKLEYKNSNDLLKKLNHSYGIIIEKDGHSSTFLPQVWSEISDKKEFLSYLCIKAGLEPNEWQKNEIVVYYYTVIVFN